ncbi:hypothetical protein ACHAWX_006725 [Stephanocyclus meneghinianus]
MLSRLLELMSCSYLSSSVNQSTVSLDHIHLYSSLPSVYLPVISHSFVKMARERKAKPDLVSRDYTIHLAKHTHKTTFKAKTPRAVKKIKEFAQKAMGTKDVRLDVEVNKFVWSQGVRNPPKRIRVRLSRKRNEDEDAEEKLYTYVQLVKVAKVKGLQTEVVDTA